MLLLFLVRRERLECNFPGNAMQLSLAPLFLRPFYFVYRVVNATPGIVRLTKFRISHCQMPLDSAVHKELLQLTEVR